MIEPQLQRVFAAAIATRRTAYAPYSHFSVGAALLTKDGKIYCGVNVENASYGLSMCAERVALYSAIAVGARAFDTLAVAGPDNAVITPCGACRQVLSEFAAELRIVYRAGAQIKSVALSALLPEAFSPAMLDGATNRSGR